MNYAMNMRSYYEQYEELQELLLCAYVDIYILDGLEQYNQSLEISHTCLIHDSFIFLNHVAGLCQDDLGISITKLFEDGNSNTIKTLNGVVHKECKRKGIVINTPKIKLNQEQTETFERIKRIRDKRVAHNDGNRSDTVVDLSDMKNLLDSIRTMLNGLCVPELDKRAIATTDEYLNVLKYKIMLGEGFMIQQSRVDISNC